MAKKDKKDKKVTDPRYIAAAENLNDIMGLNGSDEIEIEGASTKGLKKGIVAAAGLIDEGDDFADATWELLEELECAKRPAKKAAKKKTPAKGKGKGKKAAEPTDDGEKEEKKAVKKEKKGPSAYGQALDLLCIDPSMDKPAYLKALAKKKIEVSNGTNTAFSTAKSIFKRLEAAGKMEL